MNIRSSKTFSGCLYNHALFYFLFSTHLVAEKSARKCQSHYSKNVQLQLFIKTFQPLQRYQYICGNKNYRKSKKWLHLRVLFVYRLILRLFIRKFGSSELQFFFFWLAKKKSSSTIKYLAIC